MPRCMPIAAVLALALMAGRTAAQVASPSPAPDSHDAAVVDTTPADNSKTPEPVSVSPVPEPSVLLLGGTAAAGWVLFWRRKWRAPQPPTA
jgi:hypothetical protein